MAIYYNDFVMWGEQINIYIVQMRIGTSFLAGITNTVRALE